MQRSSCFVSHGENWSRSGPDGARGRILALEPLADEQAGVLVEEVAANALDEKTRTEIVRIAGGNPLFLEQLLASSRRRVPARSGPFPPTVEALLAGRLDRLDPAERALTERAAVAAETSRVADYSRYPRRRRSRASTRG